MKKVLIGVLFQVQVPDETDTRCLYLDVNPNSVVISEFTPGEDDSRDRNIAFTDLSWETTSTAEDRIK